MALSFTSYRALQSMIESLPSGPIWHSRTITVEGYTTKKPIVFIYRDAAEVVDHIFGNPIFANVMEMDPRKVYTDEKREERVYSQFMTGDYAWSCQVRDISVFGVTSSYCIHRITYLRVLH